MSQNSAHYNLKTQNPSLKASPGLVINANGTGTLVDETVTSWKVKGSELKMTYQGIESVVKWSVSGNQLTLSYPDDTSLLGMGSLLITLSPLTKQSGTNNPGSGGEVNVDAVLPSEFSISNGVLIRYRGREGSVTIPNSVTSIGAGAFRDCYDLTSVTIPNSVTTIGDWAFSGCYDLTSVTFTATSKVTTIGEWAFRYCTSLTAITIPNSVTSIGSEAFDECTSLESITFAPTSKVTSIGGSAFTQCESLTSITIPDSVTTIAGATFWNCYNLRSVTIGNSVTSIGDGAFGNCSGLTSVTFQSANIDIYYSSFPGDLLDKYLEGGIGTYIVTGTENDRWGNPVPAVWTRQ